MQDNDYFGMAQDLKRMRREFVNTFNTHMLSFESALFYSKLLEFEDYCLDQEFIITGGLPVD